MIIVIMVFIIMIIQPGICKLLLFSHWRPDSGFAFPPEHPWNEDDVELYEGVHLGDDGNDHDDHEEDDVDLHEGVLPPASPQVLGSWVALCHTVECHIVFSFRNLGPGNSETVEIVVFFFGNRKMDPYTTTINWFSFLYIYLGICYKICVFGTCIWLLVFGTCIWLLVFGTCIWYLYLVLVFGNLYIFGYLLKRRFTLDEAGLLVHS